MVSQCGVDPAAGIGPGELIALLVPAKSLLWKLLLARVAELAHVFGLLCQVESSSSQTKKKKEEPTEPEAGAEYSPSLTTTPWPKQRLEDEMSAVFSRDHLQDLVKAHLMVSSTRFTGLTKGNRAQGEAGEETDRLLQEMSQIWYSPQRQWRCNPDPIEVAALSHRIPGKVRPGGGVVKPPGPGLAGEDAAAPPSINGLDGLQGWLASTQLPEAELRKRIEGEGGEKWVSGGTTTAEIQRERYTAASHIAALKAQGNLEESESSEEEEEEAGSAGGRTLGSPRSKRRRRLRGCVVEVWHGLLDFPPLARLLTGETAIRGGAKAATDAVCSLLRHLEEACRQVLERGHAIRECDIPEGGGKEPETLLVHVSFGQFLQLMCGGRSLGLNGVLRDLAQIRGAFDRGAAKGGPPDLHLLWISLKNYQVRVRGVA